MNEPTPLEDYEVAFSAINLFKNPAVGNAPDWTEISDWHAGKLPPARSEQVLSYIANNPEYFQQWLDVCEAEQWIEQETSQSTMSVEAADEASRTIVNESSTHWFEQLKSWIAPLFTQPLPVYGGAFAALTLALLVVPLLTNTELNDLQGRLDRNLEEYVMVNPGNSVTAPLRQNTRGIPNILGDFSSEDVEQHSFGYGMRQSLDKILTSPNEAWSLWRSDLPGASLDCSQAIDTKLCNSVNSEFSKIGQWTIVAYFACQNSAQLDNDAFWNAQYGLFEELVRLPAMDQSTLLKPILQKHKPNTPATLCTAVNDLMATRQ